MPLSLAPWRSLLDCASPFAQDLAAPSAFRLRAIRYRNTVENTVHVNLYTANGKAKV
ncbi:MAG: hypothetical protein IGR76_13860 [Synechococcales cyanobacterium T60_A2020_003]|nr:hypothetical protein [Synechococcales cyanobacterium T60_A2020_003]